MKPLLARGPAGWERKKKSSVSVCLFLPAKSCWLWETGDVALWSAWNLKCAPPPLSSPLIISSLQAEQREASRFLWDSDEDARSARTSLPGSFSSSDSIFGIAQNSPLLPLEWKKKTHEKHNNADATLCGASCPLMPHLAARAVLIAAHSRARSTSPASQQWVFNGAHRFLPILSPFPLKLDTPAMHHPAPPFLRERLEHGASALLRSEAIRSRQISSRAAVRWEEKKKKNHLPLSTSSHSHIGAVICSAFVQRL